MSKHTYNDIANNWQLWCEYADPDGTFTEDEFNNMSVDEKVALQIECFGEEDHEDLDDVLNLIYDATALDGDLRGTLSVLECGEWLAEYFGRCDSDADFKNQMLVESAWELVTGWIDVNDEVQPVHI